MAKYSTSAAITLPETNAILVQVNAALTGTITVATAVDGTIAVVTNPTVGNVFRYGGLRNKGQITVTPSTTCDITVTPLDIVS